MKTSYIVFLLLLIFPISCDVSKKEELFDYLTNGKVSMWDITAKNYIKLRDTAYYREYIRSISFDVNYNCERYMKVICCDRIIDILGPKPNYRGLCNKWEILNDSTVKLNCKDVFVVKIISRDTVHLIDTLGIKQHEMYRVKPPWNIDKESVLNKNKEIESGEYLDNRIY